MWETGAHYLGPLCGRIRAKRQADLPLNRSICFSIRKKNPDPASLLRMNHWISRLREDLQSDIMINSLMVSLRPTALSSLNIPHKDAMLRVMIVCKGARSLE